jgi:hypothetical protein
MTAQEKVREIDELLKKQFTTREECERIADLRDGLKVSDLFKANDMADFTYDWAQRILGYRTVCGSTICDKLEEAAKAGYIKFYQVRRYSQFRMYCALTAKAKALLK